MATGGEDERLFPPCSERTNYARLCRMIVDLCTEILRKFLLSHYTPQQVAVLAHRCPKKSLNAQQWTLIYFAHTNRCADFDITLIYTLLRNSPVISPPNGGWGLQTLPGPANVDIGDDIERIRIIRNKVYGHLPNTKITTAVYQQTVTELEGVTTRFGQRLTNNRWNQELNQIDTDVMEPERERRYINIVSDLAESERCLRLQMAEIGERINTSDNRIDLMEERMDVFDSRMDQVESDMRGLRVTCRLTPEALTAQGITKSLIQRHREDETFISTRAIKASLNLLDEYGVAIFSGTAGSGKTSNAKEAMKLMEDKEENVLLLKISDLTKWDVCVNTNMKSVVLLDDFLGKTNINQSMLTEGGDIWNTIFACIRTGNVKVLMTIRENILTEAVNTLKMFDLFKKEHFIDLSSETFKLTNQNKRDMFERHCIDNNITICQDEHQENYQSDECLDKRVEVKLSDLTVKDIIFSNPFLGFPQSCFMFCRERRYTQLGARFFNHPTESMIKQFEQMRKSRIETERVCFCLLVYILLNKSVDLNDLNMAMLERIRKGFRLENEIKSCDLEDAINDMRSTYLEKVGQSDIFELRHQTILESVAIASVKTSPDLVLELCSLDFILEFIRIQGNSEKSGEVTVKLRQESYIYLIKRFIADFQNDQCWFASHTAFDDQGFVLKFFTELEGIADVSALMQNDSQNSSGMFMIACMYGKLPLIKKYCTMVRVPSECVVKGAEHAIKVGHQSLLLPLFLMNAADKKTSKLAALIDSSYFETLFMMLQSEKPMKLKQVFSIACISENIDLATFVIDNFPQFIDEECLVYSLTTIIGSYEHCFKNTCGVTKVSKESVLFLVSKIKMSRSGGISQENRIKLKQTFFTWYTSGNIDVFTFVMDNFLEVFDKEDLEDILTKICDSNERCTNTNWFTDDTWKIISCLVSKMSQSGISLVNRIKLKQAFFTWCTSGNIGALTFVMDNFPEVFDEDYLVDILTKICDSNERCTNTNLFTDDTWKIISCLVSKMLLSGISLVNQMKLQQTLFYLMDIGKY